MILGISGSPRKKATEHVLNYALDYLKERGFETEMITVRGRRINFCTHCDHCLKNKECIFKDGMLEVYEKIENAKGLIFATPVYNSGISAQLKALMDRTRALFAKNPNALKGKIGMGIAVGGDRIGGQELALMQIHAYLILNGAIPVSGGFFGANLGATFWSRDTVEGVMEDDEGFRGLRKTLKRFAEYLERYASSQ